MVKTITINLINPSVISAIKMYIPKLTKGAFLSISSSIKPIIIKNTIINIIAVISIIIPPPFYFFPTYI